MTKLWAECPGCGLDISIIDADENGNLFCPYCKHRFPGVIWKKSDGTVQIDIESSRVRLNVRDEPVESSKPTVKLVDEDGNVFAIMARCKRAANVAGWTKEQWNGFVAEMTAGDYDHAIQTVLKYFDEAGEIEQLK